MANALTVICSPGPDGAAGMIGSEMGDPFSMRYVVRETAVKGFVPGIVISVAPTIFCRVSIANWGIEGDEWLNRWVGKRVLSAIKVVRSNEFEWGVRFECRYIQQDTKCALINL